MTVLPPLLVAALSMGALVLLLVHRRTNLGSDDFRAFVASALAYGWVRSTAISWVSGAMGADAPYLIDAPMMRVAGVPFQELIGWLLALALASYLADRLLRVFGRSPDAWSAALVAGGVMATLCLAVETAAVSAGWWAWTLSATGMLRFPTIALLDWGFVAIDFLLPYELWRRRAPAWQRFAGLLLFPAHFAGHTMTNVWSGFPFSGFELVHLGLIAFVGAMALDRGPGDSLWPARDQERRRPLAILGAGVILATTSTQILILGEFRVLWTGLPLAFLTSVAMLSRRTPSPATIGSHSTRRTVSAFLMLLATGLFLRLPDAIRARDFRVLVSRAVTSLSARRIEAARQDLEAALVLRPDHSEVHWLLGFVALQMGDRRVAREHLETAVADRLASVDAVRTLALLDLMEGRRADAGALLARRRAQFPETADLGYLAWVAGSTSQGGGESPRGPGAPAPIVAEASGPMVAQICALAGALGDTATMMACQQRGAAGARGPR